jgi:hypothetical protein
MMMFGKNSGLLSRDVRQSKGADMHRKLFTEWLEVSVFGLNKWISILGSYIWVRVPLQEFENRKRVEEAAKSTQRVFRHAESKCG